MTGNNRKETEKDTRDKVETLKSSIDHMLETNDLRELAKTYYSSLKGLEEVFKERVESLCQD